MNLTIENILIGITIMSVVFNVYQYFKVPQEDLEKKQAVNEKEVDGKAILLAKEVEWEKNNNEKKFGDIQSNIKEAFALAQNHTHTVDVKVDKLIDTVNLMSNEITKLATILEERLPKK